MVAATTAAKTSPTTAVSAVTAIMTTCLLHQINISIYINTRMVQTKTGAAPGGNPWIDYMRVCAANYRAGHTQHHSVEGRPDSKTTERPN